MPDTGIITLSGSSSRTVFEDLIQVLLLPTTEVVFSPQPLCLTVQHMEDMEQLIRLRDAIEATKAVTLSFPVADAETCEFLFGQKKIDHQFIFTLDRKNLAYIPPRIFTRWWSRPPAA
ncbi:MAG: hypothetical protein KA731_02555 [Candidatus Moranbacteria bacterium]|nr:hypothetical protein [Candidatus Moranbacteria bacterium]MBP6034173.1 hypothetical protein [Candidatus Moranbacteria bacterium]MBP7696141.1 hypothetical protein [Candidatus Moranbacteria bacterium]